MRTRVFLCSLFVASAFAQAPLKRTPLHNTVAVNVPATGPNTQAASRQPISGVIPAGFIGTVTQVSARCRADSAVSIDLTILAFADTANSGELPPPPCPLDRTVTQSIR